MKAMYLFVDSHCHIQQADFDLDRNEVISRAKSKGIAMISSAIDRGDWPKLIPISEKHEYVFSSIGLDPLKHENLSYALQFIRENESKLIAIGEVGLDYYRERNHSERDRQEMAFKKMIEIASELKLPIQVHSRSAGKAALEVIEKNNAGSVHMHAFDGKSSLARTASKEFGYYFSIPTSVVRSPQKQKLVKAVSIEKLLLETDSPVLSAIKGERNEPSNLTIAASEVARILQRGYEETSAILLENSLRLYKKLAQLR